jgi:hypothetical protein
LSEGETNFFGPRSALTDVRQVSDDIGALLSTLFVDYAPGDEDRQRAIFVLGASILRGEIGDQESGEVIREHYLGIAERPHSRWEIEISYDDIVRIADSLVASGERPDTQIIGQSSFEVLVRDETTHSILLPPADMSRTADFMLDGKSFTATVAPPSLELLIRCALRREGFDQLAVFEQEKLLNYLIDQETNRALPEGSTVRISARRLLRVMAKPGLLSLRIASRSNTTVEELEKIATAYRVRIAYEASIAYAPVLDVNRLDRTSSQPSLVRQLRTRMNLFVQKTGYVGDQLLGNLTIGDEELSLEYIRAVSAPDPFSAFMGYYRILEYNLHEFWFDELQRKVEATGAQLARPVGGDLRSAATQAASLLGIRDRDVAFSERRGLDAIARRLDIDMFIRDLDDLEGAIEYFANGHLPFVQVENLDFRAANDDAARADIAIKLAGRVYAVRNAVTHSKASAARYSPYTDDLYLIREVPLVRIAAEQLLIPRESRI